MVIKGLTSIWRRLLRSSSDAQPAPSRPGRRRSAPVSRVALVGLVAVGTLLWSLLLDRALGLFGGIGTEPPLQVVHPANFHETRRNIEFTHDFTTNSRGLRYREIPLGKPAGTARVFVVGDSFTEGLGVEADQRFSAILERDLSRPGRAVDFINGGLSGSGPLAYGRAFVGVGLDYQPDGLLICFYANDLPGTPPSFAPRDLYPDREVRRGDVKRLVHALWPRSYTLLHTLRTNRDYRTRTVTRDFVDKVSREAAQRGIPQERIDEWKKSLPAPLVEAVNRGEFFGFGLAARLLEPTFWQDALDIGSESAERKWRTMADILSAIVATGRARGVRVAVVFIPTRLQYDPSTHRRRGVGDGEPGAGSVRAEWLSETSELQRRLTRWSRAVDVPLLDLLPTFRKAAAQNDGLTYRLDGHWTAAGHRVAAVAIAHWLRDERVFAFVTP